MADKDTAGMTPEELKEYNELLAAEAAKNKPEPAPNANKEFYEYKITTETIMKKTSDGGQKLDYYIGEVGKKIKSVFVEPRRVDTMNRAWHDRRFIYFPADKPVPEKIKRTLFEDINGDYFKDENIAG